MRSACMAVWLALAGPAAAQTTLGLQLVGESAWVRDDSLFSLPADQRPFVLRDAVSEGYLRHTDRGMVVEWAGEWRVAEGRAPQGRGRLNELFLDFAAQGLDFTVGKKVMSSGIGFGFRPLDVIQREDRRALFEARLEGVPLAAVERIDADSALSVFYLNRLALNERGATRAAHEGVVRHYRRWGDLETQSLLHLHERHGPAPGIGFTWVGDSDLELHGAALYQPRFRRLARLDTVLAASDPWYEREAREDGKALLGLTWTGEAGYSLLLEAWHDGEAPTTAEWRSLRRLAIAQRALLGVAPEAAVYGNLAWELRAFERPVLLQDNLLVRLSRDGERTDPYLELLATPEDGGHVATFGMEHDLRQGLRLSGGARWFGGPAASAYGQMPLSGVAFVQLHGEMVR